MQVENLVSTILYFLRATAMMCMGMVFLHLADREPEIKYYALYAGVHATVVGAFGLIISEIAMDRLLRRAT